MIHTQVNHWEMVISEIGPWKYHIPTATTPTNWTSNAFDDSGWTTGSGGFGYGDNDDNTIIPNNATSVYHRKTFTIQDTSTISKMMFAIDYDDGFIAYLNGTVIAFRNMNLPPSWKSLATASHEAVMFSGGLPDKFIYSKAELSSLLQQGSNTLCVQTHNNTSNSNDLTSKAFLFVGIEDTTQTYSALPNWFTPPIDLFESNLPIVVVNTSFVTIPDEPKIDAVMGIINNPNPSLNHINDPFNEFYGQIRIERRGSSSNNFPAKSYGLETNGPNLVNYNVSLFDWPSDNDWILYAPYTDKAMMRNILTYQWGRSMGHFAPRTQLCELILNNEYMGVYVLMERIKANPGRVPIDPLAFSDTLDNALTGGYILKVDKTTAGGVVAWNSPYPSAAPGNATVGLQLHDPALDTIHPLQLNYIQTFFTAFEDALAGPNFSDPQIGYAPYIDVLSFIDFFLANEISKNVDGYRISSFLYKQKYSEGGKLVAGPLWDFNIALGNANYCAGGSTSGWAKDFNSICGGGLQVPFWWSKLLTDSTYANLTHCRWLALRQNVLSDSLILQSIDSIAQQLDSASIRHYQRWPILGVYVWPNNYIGQTYSDEVNYLKTWITNRLAWMDANMFGSCESLNLGALEESTLRVFPNPSHDFVYLDGVSIPSTVRLIDQWGKPVAAYRVDRPMYKIPLDTLASGVYFLRFEGNAQPVKLIKSQP
jgi:hypothetical protein